MIDLDERYIKCQIKINNLLNVIFKCADFHLLSETIVTRLAVENIDDWTFRCFE